MQLALRASHTSQKVAHLSQKMWPSHGSQAGHHQKLSEVVPAHTAVFSRVIRLTRTPESYTEPEKVLVPLLARACPSAGTSNL